MTSASPRASALPVLLTIGTSSTATGARTPVRAPFAERARRGRAPADLCRRRSTDVDIRQRQTCAGAVEHTLTYASEYLLLSRLLVVTLVPADLCRRRSTYVDIRQRHDLRLRTAVVLLK